ncbi:MAG: NrfD/PsrC family molybdoenzyme membrane anchor subunit, partial [Chloroflexota bacterium]
YWGTGIINLVFWIGIGHAGTAISAILLLCRQRWRSAFARFAEAMTLFALATAGLFPIFHTGRPWYAYWVGPYPNALGLNSQWTSALVWDLVAISTYGIVSLLFWYIDLLPDLAIMRDKAKGRFPKFIYAFASMGWRGESKHWQRLHRVAYLLAALATPLVISVHSIIGFDFAITQLPGWHHTVFPPYFVGGALFAGFAMVCIVATMMRQYPGMKSVITLDHIENAAKFVLATSLVVGYGYLAEVYTAWYAGHIGEVLLSIERALGPYAATYWVMIFFNVVLTQLLWFKSVRRNLGLLVVICIGVTIGMWLERFVIISLSMSYGHMVSMWEGWVPTFWDWMTIITPFGLFFTLFFLFIRFVPSLAMFEVVEIDHEVGWGEPEEHSGQSPAPVAKPALTAQAQSSAPVAQATTVASDEPDDLKLIEGIGPKMEATLNAAGITTFEQIANADPEKLREIIESAGMRLIVKLNTWARQARLAADGKWDELKRYQDEI